MKRAFEITLFRADGSPITKPQVETLAIGERIDFCIKSNFPIYGYACRGKNFRNLFINEKKELIGFLVVSNPAPDSKHVTVCEFDRGLINGFEIALTHFDGRTELIVYTTWQVAFHGKRKDIQIKGVSFDSLVNGLKEFIEINISKIPYEPWNIKFQPYTKTPAGRKMEKDEIFIQRFRPHTGFGTAINKWGERVMLDWKSIADIFTLKEGSIVQATIIDLEEETKLGIKKTAIIGAITGEKMVYQNKELKPVILGDINNLSSLAETFAGKLKKKTA